MEEQKRANLYGLLGKNISYSFSQGYFSKKFEQENIGNSSYQNFDVSSVEEVLKVFENKNLRGMNVTIPYKEEVIPFLNDLHPVAKHIGAVNTIQFKNDKRIGYNTDAIGFKKSLEPLLKKHHKTALILGTGGASKAIDYVLENLGIESQKVSRKPTSNQISYQEINQQIIEEFTIVINCTPLGTFPNIEACPDIPYQFISDAHILYDLIYNPSETKFLQYGKGQGATIKNGLEMLELQAEAAWEIWNS